MATKITVTRRGVEQTGEITLNNASIQLGGGRVTIADYTEDGDTIFSGTEVRASKADRVRAYNASLLGEGEVRIHDGGNLHIYIDPLVHSPTTMEYSKVIVRRRGNQQQTNSV